MKILLIVALLMSLLQAEVRHFSDLREGLNSFIQALEKQDDKTLSDLLSPKYKEVLEVENIDSHKMQLFLNAYEETHQLVSFDGKAVYLQVGKDEHTFPVPFVKDEKGWYFDLKVGMENISLVGSVK